MKKRRSILDMRNSGLEKLLERSFNSFEVFDEWQKVIKRQAIDYANSEDDKWLYFCGCHGCGKTHLCTAICKKLMAKGRSVKYLLWNDISEKLGAYEYDAGRYENYMDIIKNTDVLYIDDLLKNVNLNKEYREVRKAYTVINARYLTGRKTIISSELLLSDYSTIDGGTAGRINEKSVLIQVGKAEGRDYRERLGGMI